MVFNMGKINTNKPTNAVLINDNSVYSPNGIALNAMVALNAQVPLGGRDLKIGSKPESALIWKIDPSIIKQFRQKPISALVLGNKPYNGGVLKNYNYTIPIVPTGNKGQPMGLLLCLTYP